MFDQNDSQTTNSGVDDALQASMPDPLASSSLDTPSDTDSPFGPPAVPSDDTAVTATPAPAADTPSPSTDDLLTIKQQALQQLSPLVGHLDQSPEERFRTTMMMIQASDDQSLLKTAYETAKQITDEKVRAQALLDVVNEINYFTQHHND